MKQTPLMKWWLKKSHSAAIKWLRPPALQILGICWIVAISAFGKEFAPPAEGPLAFRRDQIPLDSEMMATLSRQLVTLAEGLDSSTPTLRRGGAQMLALSIALDPSNSKARGLISRFQKGDFKAPPNDEQIQISREKVWKILEWLSSPEAGNAGNALAACLTDVILISDPKHSGAETMLSKEEQGAWMGWIPELAAYETKASAHVNRLPEPLPNQPTSPKSILLLPKAKISTVLWKNTGSPESENWILAPGTLEMTARIVDESAQQDEPFSILIDTQDGENTLSGLSASILTLLRQMSQGTRLPKGGQVTIGGKALEESSRSGKRQTISAAAAVLTSAALTGQEPDATVIGVMDRNGNFSLPTGFWEQLHSLTSGSGQKGRLILPTAAAEYLPSLLAYEKPQFFLDYEVILASNFSELLALSAKNPDARMTKISANFEEIRAKATPQALGQYLSNPYVRRRLLEITQENPNHYSAKLLAIQGAGNRPVYIPRKIVVDEILTATRSIQWIISRDSYFFDDDDTAKIGPSIESSRNALDGLARYVERPDRELLDKAQELVAKIRTFERVIRKKSDGYFDSDGFFTGGISDYSNVIKAHQSLLLELGEPLEGSKSPPDR